MRHRLAIAVISLAFALIGSSVRSAQPARQYSYSRSNSRVSTPRTARRHGRIIGNRQTRVYYVMAYRSRLPATRDRVYFRTVTAARAAGYQPGDQAPIPVPPSLTWGGTKHQLPSIGKQHVPRPPPKDMQKPLVPPYSQQPEVTPTNPMPN
jgi:hypothetical protein